MNVHSDHTVDVRTSEDVVVARQAVREWTVLLGFSLIEQTKMVTAASELARNTVVHGGGGTMTLTAINSDARVGLQLVFEDKGRGISDIERALRDGFTTGSGLGLGLGGARRLSNEFDIRSAPGEGTRVRIIRWRSS